MPGKSVRMAITTKEQEKNMAEKKRDTSVSEAGRKGGEATSATHDREFYEEIGHKGGEAGGKKGGQRVRELIEEGKRREDES
ncbi:KGG domain-containing protein [Azorhizophilus paspali]|uniref:KGG domain-containing protein n=1 Tax=Azorhizophilus paspali TaxID=69963 RepID=A0ABV6SKT3_AZOPA